MAWESFPEEKQLAELDIEEWVRISQVDNSRKGRGALGMKNGTWAANLECEITRLICRALEVGEWVEVQSNKRWGWRGGWFSS